jgi:hypothetical protein
MEKTKRFLKKKKKGNPHRQARRDKKKRIAFIKEILNGSCNPY